MSNDGKKLKVDFGATLLVINGMRQSLKQLGVDCETYLTNIPTIDDGAQRLIYDLMLNVLGHLEGLELIESDIKSELSVFGNNYVDKELFYDEGSLMPVNGNFDTEGEDCRKNCPCLNCPNFCGCHIDVSDEEEEDSEDEEE